MVWCEFSVNRMLGSVKTKLPPLILITCVKVVGLSDVLLKSIQPELKKEPFAQVLNALKIKFEPFVEMATPYFMSI